MKKNNKSKVWFSILLTALYMAYVFPTAVVKAESQDMKQTTTVESEADSIETGAEETTTIEETTTYRRRTNGRSTITAEPVGNGYTDVNHRTWNYNGWDRNLCILF